MKGDKDGSVMILRLFYWFRFFAAAGVVAGYKCFGTDEGGYSAAAGGISGLLQAAVKRTHMKFPGQNLKS